MVQFGSCSLCLGLSTNTTMAHTHTNNRWNLLAKFIHKINKFFELSEDKLKLSLCAYVCASIRLPVCAFWHIYDQAGAWETVGPYNRQNHIRKLEWLNWWGEKYRRKKGKERKQLSVAGGWREREGERKSRVKLNSRRAGVGERVNECVVDLLCPAPEWSVSKLSSNWWFTAPRPYQLKWANNTLS